MMLAGFQDWEAAGSEYRGGGNKDLKDRYIKDRLRIPPGPGTNQPETFREKRFAPFLSCEGRFRFGLPLQTLGHLFQPTALPRDKLQLG